MSALKKYVKVSYLINFLCSPFVLLVNFVYIYLPVRCVII